MTIYAAVDENDTVVVQIGLPDPADMTGPPEPPPDGPYTYHLIPAYITGRPNEHLLKWNGGTTQWVDPRTLDEAKTQARARVKASRDMAEHATFTCDGHTYDADPVATGRITGATCGAMMAAMNNSPFSKDFTLADNTVVTLTGAQMMAVGAALITQVGAAFDKGRSLQAEIDAATTNAAADAVVWS